MKYIFSAKAIKNIVETFFEKSLHRSAAALTYFLIMTIFPALICIQWFLGTLGEDITSFFEDYSELIPENAMKVISDYLRYTGSQPSGFLPLGIITAIITGAAAFRTLFGLLRYLFDSHGGNGAVRFAMSFLWTIAFLGSVYLSAVIMLGGKWFISIIEPILIKSELVNLIGIANLWSDLRFILLIVFAAFMLFVLYFAAQWYSPYETVAMPGAVIASLLLTIVSLIFSALISAYVNYSIIYGSLASMIILMFWLYVISIIIIIGALINREISIHKSDSKMKYHKNIHEFIKKENKDF